MKKLSKKIMIFLFGSKYPIFNKKGKIEHSREDSIETWKKNTKKILHTIGEIIQAYSLKNILPLKNKMS